MTKETFKKANRILQEIDNLNSRIKILEGVNVVHLISEELNNSVVYYKSNVSVINETVKVLIEREQVEINRLTTEFENL